MNDERPTMNNYRRRRKKKRGAAKRKKKRTVRKVVGKWYSTYRKRKALGTLPRGVVKVEAVKRPKHHYLAKVEETLTTKLSRWTGINRFYLRFLVSRNRLTRRYAMTGQRETINLNKRRGIQAERWAVYMCQSFGFAAQRVPLSGAGGMRGDVLITLPTGGTVLAEVKFSTQLTSGSEKCIRFLSEWFTALEDNVQAMRAYNTIAGVFFFKYGFSGVYFAAVFKHHLDAIAEHVGAPFHEYVHPYQQVPLIDTLKWVDTSGKTLTVRASLALRGAVFFHTDTKAGVNYELYVFPAEFLLDWIEQGLKRGGVWYDDPPTVSRSARRTYKRVAVPPTADLRILKGRAGGGGGEGAAIDNLVAQLDEQSAGDGEANDA